MKRIVIIPEILAINLEEKVKCIPYLSLGEILNKNIFNKNMKCKYNININILKKLDEKSIGKYKEFSGYYKINKNNIFFEKEYSKIRFKLLIKNVDSNNITMSINKPYFNLVRFKLDNLYPLGVHINDLLLCKFIRDDCIVIHGASFVNKSGKTYLLIAPPDTGKTYTMYKLLSEGYTFYGEDLSFYNSKEDQLYSMPFTSTWYHHFDNFKSVLNNFPIINLFFQGNKKIVSELFGKKSVGIKSKLDGIIIMEKGNSNSIKKIKFSEKKDIIRKIEIIQNNEFSYYKNPLLFSYDYFNKLNLKNIYLKEKKLISELIYKKSVYLITGETYRDFSKIILNKNIK
ncbi:hypothetical protein GOV12_05655 [Candidatus Pacearchaeota archaeon]|nr:hypothetical protein [Candidatus Pacearchaeota archaeon]